MNMEDETEALLGEYGLRERVEEGGKGVKRIGPEEDYDLGSDAEEPSGDDLTPYDLLNAAVNAVGIGNFHYWLVLVCSYGFFVDAAESSLIGIIYPTLMDKFGATESQIALIGSLTSLGMLIGAIFFGKISDSFGRRSMFVISLTICFAFSFISSFAYDVTTFAVLRLFLGVGYGGNIITCSTLLIEFLPQESRGFYSTLTGIGFGLGAVIISGIGYPVVPTIGWQWLLRIASFLALPIIGLLIFTPESPRFLVMIGEYEKAVEVMQVVANSNKKTVPVWFSAENLELKAEKHSIARQTDVMGCKSLIKGSVLSVLIPLFLVWFLNAFATVFYTWVPLEAKKKFPLEHNIVFNTGEHSSTVPSNERRFTRLIAMVGACGMLVGCALQLFIIVRLGRLVQLRTALLLCTIATLIIGKVNAVGGVYAATFFGVLFQQFVGGILYL